MKAVLALLLLVLGIAGGGALGVYLRPQAAPADPAAAEAAAEAARAEALAAAQPHYITFSRKFVVPVVEGRRTAALLVADIGIDARGAAGDRVQARKPRLRDAFLSVLFEMAATGAFSQTYTEAPILEELRRKLRETAEAEAGPGIEDVLLLDLIRKEL
jgi:flagellar basal body-associated protein FliL